MVYSSCEKLESLLDSQKVHKIDKITVYKIFLEILPSIKAVSNGEKEIIEAPLHIVGKLGELVERYSFPAEKRISIYHEIPLEIMKNISSILSPPRTQVIVDSTTGRDKESAKEVLERYKEMNAERYNRLKKYVEEQEELIPGIRCSVEFENLELGEKAANLVINGKARDMGEAYEMLSGIGQLKMYFENKIKELSKKEKDKP